MWIFPVIGWVTLGLVVLTYPAFRKMILESHDTMGIAEEIAMPLFYALMFGPFYYGGILAVAAAFTF